MRVASHYRPQFHIETPWLPDWQPEMIGTLMFVRRQNDVGSLEVLLIRKLTGHGQGKVNGPGGKLEQGEGVLAGACRELQEETGLVVSQARCAAELRFVERNGPQWLGYALVTDHYAGDVHKTAEADPFWCAVDEVPYAQMWPDDALWLPRILAPSIAAPTPGLIGNFLFDNEQLVAHEFVDPPLPPTAWRKQLGVC